MSACAKNKTLMQKADLAVSNLIADGGYLEEEQAERFILYAIEQSRLMQYVTVTSMKNHTKQLNGVHMNERILRPGTSAAALTKAQRSKPKTGQAKLVSVLLKAEVRLDDETLEDNIERGTFAKTVMSLITERIGVDLEELNIQGDTASADAFLALYDGMLKSATTNVVAFGTNTIKDYFFRDMLKTMPISGRRRRERLMYLTSPNACVDYADLLMQRGTDLGDRYHRGMEKLSYSGYKIEELDMFPENQGAGTNETSMLFLDPKNYNIGFHRQIRIETDRDITSGETIIVATLRTAGVYQEEAKVVKGTGIKVS